MVWTCSICTASLDDYRVKWPYINNNDLTFLILRPVGGDSPSESANASGGHASQTTSEDH